MFVYNILMMETPIEINIDGNIFYSNKKEIEQLNNVLDKKKIKNLMKSFSKKH